MSSLSYVTAFLGWFAHKFQCATLLKLGTHYPASLRFGDSSTNTLMSLDFSTRSDRKILERIIQSPSGDRDKLRYASFQLVSLSYVTAFLG